MKVWLKLMRFGRWLGCHQKPERSFFIKNYQFPVCARCTGVFVGQIIAIILAFFCEIPCWLSVTLMVPMGIDWSIQRFKGIMSNNIRRLITGLLCGFGLTYIYVHIITNIVTWLLSTF